VKPIPVDRVARNRLSQTKSRSRNLVNLVNVAVEEGTLTDKNKSEQDAVAVSGFNRQRQSPEHSGR